MKDSLTVREIREPGPAQGAVAAGTIPHDMEFFQDHFPGFPVLPGVVALDLLRQTAERYLRRVAQEGSPQPSLRGMEAVRFLHYLRPGDSWEARVDMLSSAGGRFLMSGRLMSGPKTAVTAKLSFRSSQGED